ncbi:MAG: carbohydrate-binding family 9-like protein [Phycisphaerales bacterium]|nr:MAG: carbohydrate-binding family 9-like protein [Phycisphaerales bacterium]
MNARFLAMCIPVLGALSAGCSQSRPAPAGPPTMVAHYAAAPVTVDGRLDEPIWARAPAYRLHLSSDRANTGQSVIEGGEVRLARDQRYLYLAARFADSDIVAEGDADQLAHWQKGDVCELFLKPEGQTWYWELYVTPRSHKSSYWFPGRGRLGVPSCFDYTCGLKAAAQCVGTVNEWRDEDSEWTAELAMPIQDLTARGERFEPGARWRVLIGRYNYSRYLPGPELTMTPRLSKTNYHLIDEFAVLELAE